MSEESDTVYVLFKLKNGKLIIGSKDLICIPKEFSGLSVRDQLKSLKEFASQSSEVAVNWPTQEGECERYLPTTNPKEKLTMVVCNVVCYSGDEDVLVSTKAAMIKSQHTTGKRKSQRRGALPPAAKKSCGVTKNSIAAKATAHSVGNKSNSQTKSSKVAASATAGLTTKSGFGKTSNRVAAKSLGHNKKLSFVITPEDKTENECSSLENSDDDDWLGPSDSEGSNISTRPKSALTTPSTSRKPQTKEKTQAQEKEDDADDWLGPSDSEGSDFLTPPKSALTAPSTSKKQQTMEKTHAQEKEDDADDWLGLSDSEGSNFLTRSKSALNTPSSNTKQQTMEKTRVQQEDDLGSNTTMENFNDFLTPPKSVPNTPHTSKRKQKTEEIARARAQADALAKQLAEAQAAAAAAAALMTDEESQDSVIQKSDFTEKLEEIEMLKSKLHTCEVEKLELINSYETMLRDKNQQIQQLQTINPQHLATVLQQGLASLEATVANVSLMASGNPPQHQSQQRTHQRQRPASASPTMVELFEGSGVMISPLSLTNAISYGLAGNNKSDMQKMINKLMDAFWDQAFMAAHSYSGKKSPTDKSDKPAKQKLPNAEVQAIINFTAQFWMDKHRMSIHRSTIGTCITNKCLSSHQAMQNHGKKSRADNAAAAAAAEQQE